MKKILTFGYRKEIVEICEKNNYKLVTLLDPWDNSDQLPSPSQYEKRILTKNNTNMEEVLFTLIEAEELSFDAVYSTHESFVVNAAVLVQTLTENTGNPLTLIAFRDKQYQKDLIRNDYHTAESQYLNLQDTDFNIKNRKFPMILKPLSGSGAEYTYIVENHPHLMNVLEKHNDNKSLPQQFILEEFISGDEWHINGWMDEGTLKFFSASKYLKPCIETKNGWMNSSITYRPEDNEELYKQLQPLVEGALLTLGLKSGVFHLELFQNDSGFVFGECGARVGGYPVPQVMKRMFNLDLHEIAIKFSLGEEVAFNNSISHHYYGETDLPPLSDKMDNLPMESELLKIEGVELVEYTWEAGTELPDSTKSTTSSTGTIIVKGDSPGEVERILKKALSQFNKLVRA